MRVVVAMVLLATLAGCLGSDKTDDDGNAEAPEAPVETGVVSYDGAGNNLTLNQTWRIATYPVGFGAEPNIGVTSTGSVFVTAFEQTMRSRDHGRTWEVVFDQLEQDDALPGDPLDPILGTSDPMLWVDTDTDRVYTDHMVSLACSNLSWSDDDGDSWTFRPLACGLPVNDHMKVMTARWHGPAPQPNSLAYGSVLYYCYNKLAATNCAVSLDGGLTYAYDRPVTLPDSGVAPDAADISAPCGGINGHPAPAPDGTVYVPLTLGCPGPVVGVTTDNGLTWTIREGPVLTGSEEIDADITVTPDGTAYMLFRGRDHINYLVRSPDQFVTWEGPWRVSPPGVTSSAFAGITSQEDGRIAMSFLGTRDDDKYPEDVGENTTWHLWQVFSLDADAETPTFQAVQVTPDEDPVQIGCVWYSGGGGGPTGCRNMLDYIDMHSDREGRTYIAFTDGCTTGEPEGDCAYNATAGWEQSRSRQVTVAVLEDGPSLVSANTLAMGQVVAPAKK